MRRYVPIEYADTSDERLRTLVRWLQEEHERIKQALDTVHDMPAEYGRTEANGRVLKDREGMMRYVGGEFESPYSRANTPHYFDGTNWIPVASTGDVVNIYQWVIDNFSVPGYGGLRLSTPDTAGADLTAAWRKINEFDAVMFNTPRGITQDLANDGLVIDVYGIWVFGLYLSFEHNESNSGREFYIRLYDETDNVPVGNGSGTLVGVSRNQPATNFSYSLPIEIPESLVGHRLIIQVGNGDTLSSIVWSDLEFALHHVSQYLGVEIPSTS